MGHLTLPLDLTISIDRSTIRYMTCMYPCVTFASLVEGIGGGTRLDSRDGHLDFEYREGERQRGLGGWGDQVPMTREVSDKCQGVVWWSWDKFTAYVDLQHVSILEAREGSRKTRVKGDVERERRYY
jgi:hypothetical protein